MSKPYTVIAILEAKKGKESELEFALKTVAKFSLLENTNIEYKLHKSIGNPHQFILYENWESKEKHQQQFEKSYIKELANKLEAILTKPYQAYFGEEI